MWLDYSSVHASALTRLLLINLPQASQCAFLFLQHSLRLQTCCCLPSPFSRTARTALTHQHQNPGAFVTMQILVQQVWGGAQASAFRTNSPTPPVSQCCCHTQDYAVWQWMPNKCTNTYQQSKDCKRRTQKFQTIVSYETDLFLIRNQAIL